MIRRLALLVSTFASIFAVAPSYGQSVLQVTVSAGGGFTSVAAGGSFALAAAGIGQPTQATVVVRYAGSSTATLSGVSLSGSPAFSLQSSPTFPAALTPGASTSFVVQYLPTSGAFVSSQASIAFSETGQAATNFLFSLTGTSPAASISYSVANGNLVNLNNGDAIAFPATNPGASTVATINFSNPGSAAGTLSAVTLTGGAFQLSNSPAPIVVAPGQTLSFNIAFAPVTTGAAQGLLSLTFGSVNASFSLSGTGAAPALSASYTLADGNVHSLSTGTAITFPSIDIGATTTATVTISNQGTGSGVVSNVAVTGASFRLNGLPLLPASVPQGQSLSFTIAFSPTQAGSYSGTFGMTMGGVSISAQLSGSTATSNISLAYIDPNTNNVGSLTNNSTLQFPATLVGAPSTVTLVATNNGQGTGSIISFGISGASASAFQLLNLPALPVAIPPGKQLQIAVRFSPPQQQTYSAALTVNINGQNLVIALSGQGTGAQYTYTVSSSSGPSPVVAGGTVTIPNTAVGQTTSVTISIVNNGSANGLIAGITVSGAGLALVNLPPFPLTLASGATQQFTLSFSPAQPGTISGQLNIGMDSFTVASTGIGSLLSYSYSNSAGSTNLAAGQSAVFAPTTVGNAESLTFTIQNTGTAAATVSSIGLAAPTTIFGLQQLPTLPLNLNPDSSISFSITFTPNNIGALTATLAINTNIFTLTGTGTQPAPLPSYQFQGASGNLQPASQPGVGLTLAAAYPLPLEGTLTLSFTSAVFTDDPSIEFANGSRTIAFTIAANSTQAVFSGNVTSVPIQTGTTAGTIVITPAFAVSGGFDVTPGSPSVLSLTVPQSAPQILSASVTSETLNSFTLVLAGYSTTRILKNFSIQVSPKQGTTFSVNQLTLDVGTASAAWYQGAASQAFGGSFLVAIPFTLQNGNSTADLVHMLQSLNITAGNDAGTSSFINVAIP